MSKNNDKVGSVSNTDEKIQPKIIQIPVQHIKTSNNSSSREESPLRNKIPSKHYNTDQFSNSPFQNRSNLFDRFDYPFDGSLNRNFGNREFDSRFPLLSKYDYDIPDGNDFFRSHQQSDPMLNPDSFFNSHPREFNNPNFNNTAHQQKEQDPSQQKTNEPNPLSNNNQSGNYNQSAIPVRRTDSPQRYISQTTIQPNQFQNQQQSINNNSPGIPIKIQHISTLPHKSDFTNINLGQDQKNQSTSQQNIPLNDPSASNIDKQSTPTTNTFKTESPPRMGNSSHNKKTSVQSDFATPLNNRQQPSSTHQNSSQQASSQKTSQPQQANEQSPEKSVEHPPHQPSPPQQPPKSAADKCEEVLNELNALEKEVENFTGKKNEKTFLKIDEYLTRCLLKLDAIERTDDKINQIRKRLINFTQLLSDKLEAKATLNENNSNKIETASAQIAKAPNSDNAESNGINESSKTTAENKNDDEASKEK